MNSTVSTTPRAVSERIDQVLLIRASAVIGLAGIALIHVIDAPDKFEEVPYVGAMFIGLIVACLAAAAMLIRNDDARSWAAASVLAAATMIGFVMSRVVGLPGDHGADLGNWSEPLGLVSLLVEGCVVLLVVARFTRRD